MRVRRTFSVIAVWLCMAIAVSAADKHYAPPGDKPRVICTTTLLSSVVTAVGENEIDVHTIVPFGMCPGHFDLTPGEADKLRNADIILYHGFENFLKGVESGPKTRLIKVGVKGNLMLPSIHTQAVSRVRFILARALPSAGDSFKKNAESYSNLVSEKAAELKNKLKMYHNMPVLCAEMNRELAEWHGFKVIAEFARDEDVSVKALHNILTIANESKAGLVIDNLQSSGKIGRTIASELNVPFVMISNFPEPGSAQSGKSSFINTMFNNYTNIMNALDSRNPSR